jgi:hypothetical protein
MVCVKIYRYPVQYRVRLQNLNQESVSESVSEYEKKSWIRFRIQIKIIRIRSTGLVPGTGTGTYQPESFMGTNTGIRQTN